MPIRPTGLPVAFAAALAVTLASCSPHHTTAPAPAAPAGAAAPVANSPANAVRRLGWAWAHRDTAVYASVLTNDFQFAFAANDSAGSAFPGRVLAMPDDDRSAHHLFSGGGSQPPATAIDWILDNVLVAALDPRPGRGDAWHRTVRTSLSATITVIVQDGTPTETILAGAALFYLTRGDSAVLSAARVAAGGRDSTRWYVDRWSDQTISSGPARADHGDPTRNFTVGSVKALYW